LIEKYDLIIIGGGSAGLAAAIQAKKEAIDNILVLERENQLGGILKQCIHDGFGLHYFNKQLTGPEYASRFIDEIEKHKIQYKLNTMVISINKEKVITTTSEKEGLKIYKAKAIILAMGCRERPRGSIRIPGTNPSGILTAGTAQKFVNIDGFLPGKKCLILGSGDIGLIMARRLTLEGVQVKAVCEIMPYPGGLARNIEQCLNDYNIPLKLSHTVVSIHGKKRLEGVTIAKVDEHFKVIEDTKEYIECDTLLLSIGLIPENELAKEMDVQLDKITNGAVVNQYLQTTIEGVFACGNVLHVHDLVDYVTLEGNKAAINASKYIKSKAEKKEIKITVVADKTIRYVLPQFIDKGKKEETIKIYYRSNKTYKNKSTYIKCGNKHISKKRNIKLLPAEMEYIEVNTKDIDEKIIYVGVDDNE